MRWAPAEKIREWSPTGSDPFVWSFIIFVLMHTPAASVDIIQDSHLAPLALSWFAFLVWSAGLGMIVLKTENLFGSIVAHGVDDFVSKVLCPLQM